MFNVISSLQLAGIVLYKRLIDCRPFLGCYKRKNDFDVETFLMSWPITQDTVIDKKQSS
jgi:hypothetical protein